LAAQLGFGAPEHLWRWVGAGTGIDSMYWRLVIYVSLHAAIVYLARRPLTWVQSVIESGFDSFVDGFHRLTGDRPKVDATARGIFTIIVTLILVPFLIQPTLVCGYTTPKDWLKRVANLADGTASTFVVDSVFGAYRRYYVGDVQSEGGVEADEVVFEYQDGRVTGGGDIEEDGSAPPPEPTGDRPMMDRWDPTIEKIAGGNPQDFAYVKAFMWVESGGRQFAVSHTGCSGLMQFCSGTSRQSPFREVFGRGSIYTCGCNPDCDTPDKVIEALETGNRDQIKNLEDKFPCDLTDARFEGKKSLKAGKLYIDRLSRDYEDNLYLMYIGYNSGPAVADKVWRKLGRDPSAGLDRIETHLSEAMSNFFPQSHDQRARSLLQTHLPKLKRAYDRYYEPPESAFRTDTERRLACAQPRPDTPLAGRAPYRVRGDSRR
ncbi:MAG: transglycosylase SLT domain-containing protein, partial [Bradymonadaceae bacterium]